MRRQGGGLTSQCHAVRASHEPERHRRRDRLEWVARQGGGDRPAGVGIGRGLGKHPAVERGAEPLAPQSLHAEDVGERWLHRGDPYQLHPADARVASTRTSWVAQVHFRGQHAGERRTGGDGTSPASAPAKTDVISTGDFKRGLRILVEGDPYVILDVHVQSPSARGASSLSKLKVRNLRTGQVLDKTFRGGDKIDEPDLELRPVQFLYKDDAGFHFMDAQSYDQFTLSAGDLGDASGYLRDGLDGIRSVVFNGKVISVDLPQTVVLRVTDTQPAMKGATAQAQTKPATLETGLIIQVPSYLESDELVLVDTREGRFMSRAKG